MSVRRKIIWLDPADFLGGAEMFSLDVLPYLAEDFEITVLTGEKNIHQFSGHYAVETFSFSRLKPITPVRIFQFFQATKKLRKYIEKAGKKFDLVHTNSIRAHILASQAIKKIPPLRRPKLSFFVHDFTFPAWAVKRYASSANLICACSQGVRNDLIQKGASEKKISVIPNGVDLKKFQNTSQKSFDEKHPILGIIGRLDIWKGQDIFLQSAKILLNEYPDAQLKFFGESSSHDPKTVQFEKKLRAFVSENNLSENVEFCGFVPVEHALSQIDILIHSSTEAEPFGRVIIEALAIGVPVVASNFGGPSEILTDRKNGLLVTPGDPDALVQAIKSLLTDAALRAQFGEKGKELVRKRYTVETTCHQIKEGWESVLQCL